MSSGLVAGLVLVGAGIASAVLVAPYAVGGVHLGDSPATAQAALKGEAYSVTVRASFSYQQRLSAMRGANFKRTQAVTQPAGVGSFRAINGSQQITVTFDDDASGRRVVSRVLYSAPELAHPYGTSLKTLVTRYGQPTIVRPYGAVWCYGARLGSSDDDGCDVGVTAQDDNLSVRPQGGFGPAIILIDLQVGKKTLKAWATAHEADLRRLVRERDAF